MFLSQQVDQAKPFGDSCSLAKCAAASLKKSFSLLSSRFSLRSRLSSARSSLVSRPWSFGPLWPRSMRACRTQRARLLDGRPRRWATALQERPSCRQSSTASAFCCAVNRRLVLVGEFIDGQSGGHGVTPIDLSLKSGEAQAGIHMQLAQARGAAPDVEGAAGAAEVTGGGAVEPVEGRLLAQIGQAEAGRVVAGAGESRPRARRGARSCWCWRRSGWPR